jgi:hypothetical protein
MSDKHDSGLSLFDLEDPFAPDQPAHHWDEHTDWERVKAESEIAILRLEHGLAGECSRGFVYPEEERAGWLENRKKADGLIARCKTLLTWSCK